MLTIATICARGGSQGLPGKNIRPLLGKPLIVHTIHQAISHPQIDRVFVSTDSEEIASIAKSAGAEVPFIRPNELSGNKAPKHPVIQHLVDWVVNNVGSVSRIVDLDPTSPLREASDISACLGLLDNHTDVVITAYEADKNPYFNMVEIKNSKPQLVKKVSEKFYSRQKAPKVFEINAGVYAWSRKGLLRNSNLINKKTHYFFVPSSRSIDIDNRIDFKIVKSLFK